MTDDGDNASAGSRNLVFCFDGTWNKIDSVYPTNVARIAQSISRMSVDGRPQIVYYDQGVGTDWYDHFLGGVFGMGLTENITDAYNWLVLNYQPGDRIFVFGFSRGAFTARSFVGLIRNCGIISRRSLTSIAAAVKLYRDRDQAATPNSDRARQFRMDHCPTLCLPGDRDWRAVARPGGLPPSAIDLSIRYLGVWDTVGALGIPRHLTLLAFANRKWRFHNTQLSSFVECARHAVSTDERRKTFEPALWDNIDDLNQARTGPAMYEQLMFPGTHGGVGGGGPVRGLSDGGLQWIFRAAKKQGLAFDLDPDSPVFQIQPDHRAQLFNETGKVRWTIKDWLTGLGLRPRPLPEWDRRNLHKSLIRRFHTPIDQLPERTAYRPPSLKYLWAAIEQMNPSVNDALEPIETKAFWDPRALQAPIKVVRYQVKPGDTLTKIAEQQMAGAKDTLILFMHNQQAGILFDPDELYAGVTIEIPTYADPPAIEPADTTDPQVLPPPS